MKLELVIHCQMVNTWQRINLRRSHLIAERSHSQEIHIYTYHYSMGHHHKYQYTCHELSAKQITMKLIVTMMLLLLQMTMMVVAEIVWCCMRDLIQQYFKLLNIHHAFSSSLVFPRTNTDINNQPNNKNNNKTPNTIFKKKETTNVDADQTNAKLKMTHITYVFKHTKYQIPRRDYHFAPSGFRADIEKKVPLLFWCQFVFCFKIISFFGFSWFYLLLSSVKHAKMEGFD